MPPKDTISAVQPQTQKRKSSTTKLEPAKAEKKQKKEMEPEHALSIIKSELQEEEKMQALNGKTATFAFKIGGNKASTKHYPGGLIKHVGGTQFQISYGASEVYDVNYNKLVDMIKK